MMIRRTTIAAAATALALLGGGSALAANAGLFAAHQPDGAGTLPAVSTPDGGAVPGPAPAGYSAIPPTPSTTNSRASSVEDRGRGGTQDESHAGTEAERDD
jgi:hypothetical protein